MSDGQKTAITNVRVFDGTQVSDLTTIVFEDGKIVADADGALEIDGEGCILLPGLIDAHVHINKLEHLRQLAKAGVTTGRVLDPS